MGHAGPEDLSAWVEKQPAGEQTNHLLDVASGVMAEEAPENALRMVDRISDPKLREQSLIHAWRIWSQNDPDAARSWLDRSPLPPELTGRLTGGSRKLK